jgi:hypothetical protein
MAPLHGAWVSMLVLSATAHLQPGPAAAAAAAAGTRCAIAHDKVIGAGHNFGVAATVASYPACCALCQQHAPACKAWTWHPPDSKTFPSKCLMHSEDGPTIHEGGVISGVPSAHLPPPPPPPPLNCPASRNFSSAAEACAAFDLPTKIDLMHGFGWGGQDAPTPTYGYSRNSGCGCACGRQYFRWDNGPQGFGDGSGAGNSTQWPSTLNAAATFDPELCEEWGTAMGEEFWNKGSNIQEGPGLNIARIEKNGRTFEYLSGGQYFCLTLLSVGLMGCNRTYPLTVLLKLPATGEDPVLGGQLGVPLVKGIQKHVMAIAKHCKCAEECSLSILSLTRLAVTHRLSHVQISSTTKKPTGVVAT